MRIKQIFLKRLLVTGVLAMALAVLPIWNAYALNLINDCLWVIKVNPVVSDTKVTNPDGSTTETKKHRDGETETIKIYPGGYYITDDITDDSGKPIGYKSQTEDGKGGFTTYTINKQTGVWQKTEVNPDGFSTTTTYDPTTEYITIVTTGGSKGRKSVKVMNGNDLVSNTVTTPVPGGGTYTVITDGKTGNLTKIVTDANGNSTTTVTDENGNLISLTTKTMVGKGGYVETTTDGNGQVVSTTKAVPNGKGGLTVVTTDNNGDVTTDVSDASGDHTITVTYPDGSLYSTTTITADGNGGYTSVTTDENGNVVSTITKTVDKCDSVTTVVTTDQNGNVVSTITSPGNAEPQTGQMQATTTTGTGVPFTTGTSTSGTSGLQGRQKLQTEVQKQVNDKPNVQQVITGHATEKSSGGTSGITKDNTSPGEGSINPRLKEKIFSHTSETSTSGSGVSTYSTGHAPDRLLQELNKENKHLEQLQHFQVPSQARQKHSR